MRPGCGGPTRINAAAGQAAVLASIPVLRGGLATSGDYERFARRLNSGLYGLAAFRARAAQAE